MSVEQELDCIRHGLGFIGILLMAIVVLLTKIYSEVKGKRKP